MLLLNIHQNSQHLMVLVVFLWVLCASLLRAPSAQADCLAATPPDSSCPRKSQELGLTGYRASSPIVGAFWKLYVVLTAIVRMIRDRVCAQSA